MLAQDSSCAPPPQREHSPTDVHHARGQSATATEGESGCRKSTHRSASSTENRDTPPTAVARKGKANVDTGAGKAPTPRIDDTSSAPTRKANVNTDAAKAPTLCLENMPSSSSTRRGKSNKNRGAAKAPTHSDNTQAPPKTKRRDKSPDSGVISRPTSGLDRDQAAAGKADRGPGLMLPDIPNWIVTNRLNWEDRYEAHMDRYAKTPDLTSEDPVRAASYLEICESGMVVDFPGHPERINMWRPMVSVEQSLPKLYQLWQRAHGKRRRAKEDERQTVGS